MKIYNVCIFVFRFVMVLVLARFLNSSFVINPQKEAPTSQFYSSKHVENRRENVLLFMFWIIRTALK